MAQLNREMAHLPEVQVERKGFLAGRAKVLLGGAIILGAMVLLALMNFRETAVFYLTPSEVLAQAQTLYGQNIRLAGTIDKRSVEWDPASMTLKFNVYEGRDVIPVVYNQPKPDTFDLAEAVTLEGVYRSDGVFEAHTLFLQCPSKYEAQLEERQ
jgi:cytochrome c-type biogenesis protein CcmE